ncbi:unnamed protein product [Vitrella brassicaformis CCMP3155]|uniref:Fe2OG dioxygenase domain-containing protein n=2 Tax=Vitrella brassicaformis TaxID=1169539 RepID=A0A0G4FPI0_VITBC|nr:unnamed protein product [Vitrella brassicaformis CCMP3155]|eukprot:CEM16355.1 unnamed protein product [Vitrella brassicaformis CCMP3155]
METNEGQRSAAHEIALEMFAGQTEGTETEGSSSSSSRIPVIDLTGPPEVVRRQIWDAAANEGFFQVVGHGIDWALIDELFAMAEAFFDLFDKVEGQYGYTTSANAGWEKNWQRICNSVTPSDLKESFQMTHHTDFIEGSPLWPKELPQLKQHAARFMQEAHRVTLVILSHIAVSLGLPPSFFEAHLDWRRPNHQSGPRLHKYHDVTDTYRHFPPNTHRIAAHTDWALLTLLFQREGQGGLRVCPGMSVLSQSNQQQQQQGGTKELQWIGVEPMRDAICVNIGDSLKGWSDDQLQSTFHRVRLPREGECTGPRYSMVYFAQANKDSIIQGPNRTYPPISAGDFIWQRIKSTFPDRDAS